jgi:hypothetical protein
VREASQNVGSHVSYQPSAISRQQLLKADR